MNLETAQALVRSLVGRLKLRAGFWRLPKARLSDDEVLALKLLSGSETQAMAVETTNVEHVNVSPKDPGTTAESTATRIEIDHSVLKNDGPLEKEIRLCIDFGTAMSKACATLATDTAIIPLRLDLAVGENNPWLVPSSLYIGGAGGVSNTHRIYFGAAAERQHSSEIHSGSGGSRMRFDNLKWMLSEQEPHSDLYRIRLPAEMDPTGLLTYGDALLIYLAWLTDHACICLKDRQDNTNENGALFSGSARAIRRRFAIPCFESAEDIKLYGKKRAEWAKSVLEETMAYAQVIADTFQDRWLELTVEDALPVLQEVRRSLDIEELKENILAVNPDIREPLAAGASQFAEHVEQEGEVRQRRRLLVVDAGAGTTDFALFEVVTAQGRDIGYSLVTPSVRMCREAGNSVDRILREIIVKKCRINKSRLSDQELQYANIDLDSQLRQIKENVFDDRKATFNLRPGIAGELDIEEVEQHEGYKELGKKLFELRKEIMQQVVQDESPHPGAHTKQPVDVLLTGGSSVLPVFRRLAEGKIEEKGWEFEFRPVGGEWIDYLVTQHEQDIVEQYPQLAVAIGGAAPWWRNEIPNKPKMILPTPSGGAYIPPIYKGE